jgi:hypothetical protein
MKKNQENNAARECRPSFPGRGSGKGKTGLFSIINIQQEIFNVQWSAVQE